MTRLYAGSAMAVVAALLGGTVYFAFFRGAGDDPFGQCRTGRVAGAAEVGGPFELVNAAGQTVTDAEVITEPTLLYFGYSFCPDVCPFDMARNAEAVDILEELGHAATPVFVSVDPDRDTPEVVGAFAGYLHPKAVGLTGSPEQIRAAASAYRVYYKKQDGDPEYYLVDHSTFTYLVLPDHGFVEFFRRETSADQMAQAAACFIDAAG